MKKLTKICVWLIVHIIAFVLVAWIFLGLTPLETYQKFTTRMSSIRNGTFSFVSDAADAGNRLGKTANRHYNDSERVRQGHDPYEDYNADLDARTRNIGQ